MSVVGGYVYEFIYTQKTAGHWDSATYREL